MTGQVLHTEGNQMSVTIPSRTYDQRIEALQHANRVRFAKAELRRSIHALSYLDGRERVACLLEDPSPVVLSMPVGRLLMSIRWVGRPRTSKWLGVAGVQSADRRVRELSPRQRQLLAMLLRMGSGKS